jgi:hypothetical protein
MANTAKAEQSRKSNSALSLQQQAHQQVMDLLRLADKSPNPDIRAAAIDLAKRSSKYEQKQGARLSLTTFLWLNVGLGVITGSLCWYALLYLPRNATALCRISILIFIILSGISLFLCGLLSQSNLMKLFGLAKSYVMGKLGRKAAGDKEDS